LFNTESHGLAAIDGHLGFGLIGAEESVTIPYRAFLDFKARCMFLAFFVPQHEHAFDLCAIIAKEFQTAIDSYQSTMTMASRYPGDMAQTDSKELHFTGRIYIYHENHFSLMELGQLESVFKERGLGVIFRGHEYMVMRWREDPKPVKP
jgi:hypothetical protein